MTRQAYDEGHEICCRHRARSDRCEATSASEEARTASSTTNGPTPRPANAGSANAAGMRPARRRKMRSRLRSLPFAPAATSSHRRSRSPDSWPTGSSARRRTTSNRQRPCRTGRRSTSTSSPGSARCASRSWTSPRSRTRYERSTARAGERVVPYRSGPFATADSSSARPSRRHSAEVCARTTLPSWLVSRTASTRTGNHARRLDSRGASTRYVGSSP